MHVFQNTQRTSGYKPVANKFSNFYIQKSEFHYCVERSSDIQLPVVNIAPYRVLIFILILSHTSTSRSPKWFCLSGSRILMLYICLIYIINPLLIRYFHRHTIITATNISSISSSSSNIIVVVVVVALLVLVVVVVLLLILVVVIIVLVVVIVVLIQ